MKKTGSHFSILFVPCLLVSIVSFFFIINFFISQEKDFVNNLLSVYFQNIKTQITKTKSPKDVEKIVFSYLGNLTEVSFPDSEQYKVFRSLLNYSNDIYKKDAQLLYKGDILGHFNKIQKRYIIDNASFFKHFFSNASDFRYYSKLFFNDVKKLKVKRYNNLLSRFQLNDVCFLALFNDDTDSLLDEESFFYNENLSVLNKKVFFSFMEEQKKSKENIFIKSYSYNENYFPYKQSYLLYTANSKKIFVAHLNKINLGNFIFISPVKAGVAFFIAVILFLLIFKIIEKLFFNGKSFKVVVVNDRIIKYSPMRKTVMQTLSNAPETLKYEDSSVKNLDDIYFVHSSCHIMTLGTLDTVKKPPLTINFFLKQQKSYQYETGKIQFGNYVVGHQRLSLESSLHTFVYNLKILHPSMEVANKSRLLLLKYMEDFFMNLKTRQGNKPYDFLERYAEGLLHSFYNACYQFLEENPSLKLEGMVGILSPDSQFLYFYEFGKKLEFIHIKEGYALNFSEEMETNFLEKKIYAHSSIGVNKPISVINLQEKEAFFFLLLDDLEENLYLTDILQRSLGYFDLFVSEVEFLLEQKEQGMSAIVVYSNKNSEANSEYSEKKAERSKNLLMAEADKYFQKGMYQKAEESYRQALYLKFSKDIYFKIFLCLNLQEKDKEQEILLQEALNHFSYYPEFLFQLSLFYKRQRDFEKAKIYSLRLFLFMPFYSQNLINLIDIYRIQGKREEALKLLAQVEKASLEDEFLEDIKSLLQED